jgi:anti-sigma B factor antagonist
MRPGDLTIEDHVEGARHRLALSGELDLANAQELIQTVGGLCDAGASEIVLDLRKLAFMDSTGLRAIAECLSLSRSHSCAFSLTPAPAQVQRVFEIAGVEDMFDFKDPV